VDQKLEAIVVPVSDVDRSRHFYRALGFRLDRDQTAGHGVRIVELTPPGSTCSIIIGTGISTATPGSTLGVLAVGDLLAARSELLARGAVPSEVFEYRDGRLAVSLHDPDGNQWLLVNDVPLNS
jgi:catechol 2,3-dioxygenase-like lactoylglutathione lyase family enzyme